MLKVEKKQCKALRIIKYLQFDVNKYHVYNIHSVY